MFPIGMVKTLVPGDTDAAKPLSDLSYEVCSTTIERILEIVEPSRVAYKCRRNVRGPNN